MIIRGYITKGHGNFSKKYTLPGNIELTNPPELWPESFSPGTVNFRINDDFSVSNSEGLISYFCEEIPDILHELIEPASVFAPEVFQKGFHDDVTFAWRARLRLDNQEKYRDCWVLRRSNATYKKQLELISEISLRNHFGIPNENKKYFGTVEIFHHLTNPTIG